LNDGNEDNKSRIWLVTLAPSYYYNWVISNRVLVSTGIAIGSGFNVIDGDSSGIIESSLNFKLGYNSDAFFSFVNLNYSNFVQDNKNLVRFNENLTTFRVTAGYRFARLKKLNNYMTKVLRRLVYKKKAISNVEIAFFFVISD